jgi:hypothetical protein
LFIVPECFKMRRLTLTATAAALALAACGKNNQTDNANVVADNLTAASIVSNDVTAIDAVTGDAANMAADVDMNYGDIDNAGTPALSAEPDKPVVHGKTKPAISTATDKSAPASTTNTATNQE